MVAPASVAGRCCVRSRITAVGTDVLWPRSERSSASFWRNWRRISCVTPTSGRTRCCTAHKHAGRLLLGACIAPQDIHRQPLNRHMRAILQRFLIGALAPAAVWIKENIGRILWRGVQIARPHATQSGQRGVFFRNWSHIFAQHAWRRLCASGSAKQRSRSQQQRRSHAKKVVHQ